MIFKYMNVVFQQESGESRYVSCRGNPGAGKTLQVHRLVCIWMDSKNDKLKDFHAVFVLPLRDIVYKEDPLLKILGSDMNGLKYIANEDIEMFNMYLSNNKAISTKILFILDGVDEAQFSENSEIYKLLTRQIFPDVSIMVTSRPESSVLNDMYLKPLLDTYVYIRGTSDTGITQYLQDVLSFPSNGPTMEQRTCVIKRCKTEMTDLTLHIPLYLALIGFILRKHWETHHSFDQLDLPDRATQLVNTFVRVQLRIWLQRLQRYGDAKQLDFNRSPLEEGCTVPIDILSKLVSFGKLSYNLINDNMSSFKRGQLNPLLIDFNDIQQSGFFSITTDSIKFHHKQIQEYLAAIYISHEKYNEITFKQLFTRLSDRPQTILETFQNIEMVIKFVFGISPGFAMDILKNFKKCGVVVPYIKPIGIVLNYEASLCWESDDEKITAEMRELFLNCKRKSVEQYAFEESVLKTKLTMDHLFTGVTKKDVHSIIEQWYNSFITENDTETSYHLEMKELDTFLMYLLHHYDSTFNNVRSLNIHESSMTDINFICNFFPKLEYVKANVIAVTDNNTFFTMDCSQPKYHTLKHLTLQSGTGSLNFCLSLLDQTELHSLRLSNVNSQSIIPLETANLNWKKMKTLELHLFEIDPIYALNVVKAVDNVLRSIPSLVSLSLGCARNKMSPTGNNMSYLLKAVGDFIEAHSEHLSTLGMFNIMDIDSLSTLLQKLPELPHLEVVGFGELSEHSSIDFNQVFIKCQKLKNIQVATKKDEITIRSQFTSTFKKYKRSLNLYVYDCDILQQRFVCDLNMPKNAEKIWLARRIRQRHQPIPVKSNWFFDQLELWSKC